MYQGQELGLKNFPRSWGIEEYKDVASINYWNKYVMQQSNNPGLYMLMFNFVCTGYWHSVASPPERRNQT